MQIARRGFQSRVSQQKLNLADIAAGFQQMRGEGVAAMPLPGLCRGVQNEVLEDPKGKGLLAHQPFNMRHSPEARNQSCLRKASNSSSG